MNHQIFKNVITLASAVLLISSCTAETFPWSVSEGESGTAAPTAFHTIAVPSDYAIAEGGGEAYHHIGDHYDSMYYAHPDFYNMDSTDSLTLLSKFKTYQQTTEVTCGPASALMVLEHFGHSDYDELGIAEIMETHQDKNETNIEDPGVADEQGEYGTSTTGMVRFFEQIGWNVSSSLTEANEEGVSFADPIEFQAWVQENLAADTPIMIEWIDWMGHWQVIIGYDTMGTETTADDVLILADPYDTSDHWQDGYYIVPAERFFYMWEDANILPEGEQTQQWIIATPPIGV